MAAHPSRALRTWGRGTFSIGAAAAALLFVALWTWAQVPVPALTARVTDLTDTLTAEQRKSLEERFAAFEARKGSQIAVLLVPTTEPETIEQFGIRVAEQWKVGRKNVDDGAILIVAMKDRTVRIEVGYGLEGALPDAVVKRIIEEDIVPRFKQGDFYGGVGAGTSRMMSVLEGEALPPPPERRRASGTSETGIAEFLMIVAMMIFVVGGLIRALLGRVLGSALIGGLGGVLAWVIIGSIAAGVVTAIAAVLLSLMGGMAGLGGRGRRGWGAYSAGGWGRGGGFGGGSWGGGGGGFGGGGASGRW